MGGKSLLPGGESFVGPLSPSELARIWQGSGAYPGIDTYTNVTLSKGNYVVGSVSGQSPYYTTLAGFAGTNGTAQNFYPQLQILRISMKGSSSGQQGGEFKACSNCSGITPINTNVTTGRVES